MATLTVGNKDNSSFTAAHLQWDWGHLARRIKIIINIKTTALSVSPPLEFVGGSGLPYYVWYVQKCALLIEQMG